MRESLQQVLEEQVFTTRTPPGHAGLAYERWAWRRPRPEAGASQREQQGKWDTWLEWVESFAAPEGYGLALERWRKALEREPLTRCLAFETESRLLVGHGNPSGTEVGLSLHHTWGVPVVPGSALKGLTAHYVQAVYGPTDPSHPEPERAPYQGVRREENRLKRGPGEVYRLLFGAPEVDEQGPQEAGACEGRIVFHDALWLPPRSEAGEQQRPLARDVLTVHQRQYYTGQGAWPHDYDSPNPVAFLTVRPGTRFLVALGVVPSTCGAGELLGMAWRFLGEALGEWGVGGKSSAGYGRMKEVASAERGPPAVSTPPARAPAAPASPVLSRLGEWLAEQKRAGLKQRQTLAQVEAQWLPRLLALAIEERTRAFHLLRGSLKNPKLEEQVKSLGERLLAIGSEQ